MSFLPREVLRLVAPEQSQLHSIVAVPDLRAVHTEILLAAGLVVEPRQQRGWRRRRRWRKRRQQRWQLAPTIHILQCYDAVTPPQMPPPPTPPPKQTRWDHCRKYLNKAGGSGGARGGSNGVAKEPPWLLMPPTSPATTVTHIYIRFQVW